MGYSIDIVEGNRGKKDSKGFKSKTRIALVYGLPSGSDNAIDVAINTLNSAGYSLGSQHPTYTELYLSEYDASALSDDTVQVTLSYERKNKENDTSYVKISVGATLQQSQANTDNSGALVYTEYTDEDGKEHPKQYGTFSILLPNVTFSYSKTQSSSPGSDAIAYVGKVNATTFKGLDAGTVLCTAITGDSEDSGSTYDCRYDFHYKADGWKKKIIYTDPETGKPPSNIDAAVNSGKSIKEIGVYTTAEFNDLGL
jgi:hypothetical protein